MSNKKNAVYFKSLTIENVRFTMIMIVIFSMISCTFSKKVSKVRIVGVYENKNEFITSTFFINNDNTFKYTSSDGSLYNFKSSGKWKTQENFIHINSFLEYNVGIIEVKEEVSSDYKIKLKSIKNEQLPFNAEILLKSGKKVQIDNGNTATAKGIVERITILQNTDIYVYVPKSKNSTQFNFVVKSSSGYENSLFFKNELLKIKNNKIIFNGKVFKKIS